MFLYIRKRFFWLGFKLKFGLLLVYNIHWAALDEILARSLEHILSGMEEIKQNENHLEDFYKEQMLEIFHLVHCYLHGEISIFISGRALIQEETAFKQYVLKECIKISRLLTIEE